MKKVSFIAIVGAAGLLSSAALAGGASSVAQGVNIGSQTQIGVNNIQGSIQGVSGGHIDSINNMTALTTFQAEGEVHLDPHAFSIGSNIESANGGNGGASTASVDQTIIAKVETSAHEALLVANKGGEIGGGKALAAGLASVEGVAGGAGGAGGEAKISTIDSNNLTITNTTTSTADYHPSLKIETGDINVAAANGIVANRSLNDNTVTVPVTVTAPAN